MRIHHDVLLTTPLGWGCWYLPSTSTCYTKIIYSSPTFDHDHGTIIWRFVARNYIYIWYVMICKNLHLLHIWALGRNTSQGWRPGWHRKRRVWRVEGLEGFGIHTFCWFHTWLMFRIWKTPRSTVYSIVMCSCGLDGFRMFSMHVSIARSSIRFYRFLHDVLAITTSKTTSKHRLFQLWSHRPAVKSQ